MNTTRKCSIVFVGAGQMATALAVGMVAGKVLQSHEIQAVDPDPSARERFGKSVPGSKTVASFSEMPVRPDLVLLAVKPQLLDDACSSLNLLPQTGVMSVVAGATIERLSRLTGSNRVIRAMPNTPALISAGVTAVCFANEVSEDDRQFTEQLFSAVGTVVRIEERLMDAVTGLSGSGPAFVFRFIEALIDGGVNAGLPRDKARLLAIQTVLGSAKMLLERNEHPRILADQVTSPGGTTAAGLRELELAGFSSATVSAILAATRRAGELG